MISRSMELSWTAQAKKDLRALPKEIQKRIAKKILWYLAQPHPFYFAKPLVDMPGLFRFRIGEYRAIVSPDGVILVVLRIQNRSEAYRKK
jgi:mRNA-degrading endonuclease RelE of RelBE toxin-antitoxin system